MQEGGEDAGEKEGLWRRWRAWEVRGCRREEDGGRGGGEDAEEGGERRVQGACRGRGGSG